MPTDTTDSLRAYERAETPLPTHYRRWHLYGAGLENVGRAGKPEEVMLPTPGPDEILVRHDACGICYSDIKIINLGGSHPRLAGRDLAKNPVVMGHEVALTVVGVGENRQGQFAVGQRFIVQADVYFKGVNLAYGYALTGGMSQYGLIGPEVLDGDEGCYLLPIQNETGYAEAALVEPWACVEAAYHWKLRHEHKPDGQTLLMPTDVKLRFEPGWDNSRGQIWWGWGFDWNNPPNPRSGEGYDDIFFSGSPPSPARFEKACARLAKAGTVHVTFDKPLKRPVRIDVGRIHYDGHSYVGRQENRRCELKGGGVAWFIGAAGPMGQMHVQRALSLPHPPRRLVCTDRHTSRLETLRDRFSAMAEQRGVELILVNVRETTPDYKQLAPDGFDDIVVMVPSVEAIEEAFPLLAHGGVLNIFAGVARGTMATLDISDIALKNVRIVGTSGSSIEDMRRVRDLMESDQLDTGASLAAIGGLEAFRDGLEAVQNSRFPGKTVIFPHVPDLPLTGLPDLKTVRPNVYAKLRDGKFWSNEAEEELFREALDGARVGAGH